MKLFVRQLHALQLLLYFVTQRVDHIYHILHILFLAFIAHQAWHLQQPAYFKMSFVCALAVVLWIVMQIFLT